MAIAVSISVDNAHPAHGDTVTATYLVTGLSPIVGTLQGSVMVNGKPTPATLTMGDAVGPYSAPTIAGLTFKATADPKVFTALVP